MEEKECLSNLIKLPDGRVLEYVEYGDLNGTPVLYNHGMPGSAFEANLLHDVFKDNGLRVICPNRPGIGRSSKLSNHSLQQITEDAFCLLNLLECHHVTVIGWSSGGVPSLWQAKHSDTLISQVILLSSYSHFAELDQAPAHFVGHASLLKQLTTHFPIVGLFACNVTGYLAKYFPSVYFKILVNQCHTQDVEIIEANPLFSEILLEAQRQSFSQSASGLFVDLLSQFGEWPFFLKSIECPVTVFQGDCDTFVPERIGQHLADCLPNVDYQLLPGQGHMYWLEDSFQYRLAHLCQI